VARPHLPLFLIAGPLMLALGVLSTSQATGNELLTGRNGTLSPTFTPAPPRTSTAGTATVQEVALPFAAVISTTPIPRSTPTPRAITLPWVPYHEAHPLLAYYYAWWEPEKIVSGWPYTPLQQYPGWVRQLVDDPDLLRQHILQAQAAGIDGFIVNRAIDLRMLLDVARGSDFRLTLQVNAEDGDPTGEIEDFYQHLDSPSLVRHQGQPVLFFWRAGRLGNDFWFNLRAHIDPHHDVLWIADGDNFSILGNDVWDGISPYAIAWSLNPRGQLPAWAAKARAVAATKLFIPPVSPGCDDHLARATTCLQGRADGSYYQATLDGAVTSNPPWAIVVSTFNEWLEATQIEPALEYGDYYLRLTRRFADRWRGEGSDHSVGSVPDNARSIGDGGP
jgi:hypothetical protein